MRDWLKWRTRTWTWFWTPVTVALTAMPRGEGRKPCRAHMSVLVASVGSAEKVRTERGDDVLVDQLGFSYCEGWDAGRRRAAGPLSPVRAEKRNRDGEQYTVLLCLGERPMATIDVAWKEHYCAVWLFDEPLRRRYQADFRRLAEDRMFLTHTRRWDYRDDTQAEFDERAVTRTLQISLDGRMTIEDRPGGRYGGLAVTHQNVSAESYWDMVPAFGDWRRLAEMVLRALGHEVAPDLVLCDTSDPRGEGLPAGRRPWRPPAPLRPARFDPMFAKGTRYRLERGAEVVVDTHKAGALRMTSGTLAAADPGWLKPDAAPFTVGVAARRSAHRRGTPRNGRRRIRSSRNGGRRARTAH